MIGVLRAQFSDRFHGFFQAVTKGGNIFRLRSEGGDSQWKFAIKLSKMRRCIVELHRRKDKSAEHPGIGRTNVLGLLFQCWPKIETARRKHSGVIDRFMKKSAE